MTKFCTFLECKIMPFKIRLMIFFFLVLVVRRSFYKKELEQKKIWLWADFWKNRTFVGISFRNKVDFTHLFLEPSCQEVFCNFSCLHSFFRDYQFSGHIRSLVVSFSNKRQKSNQCFGIFAKKCFFQLFFKKAI